MIVYAGLDPVTGKRTYLRKTIEGTDKAAQRRAQKQLNKFLTQVDEQRAPSSSVTLSYVLDEWMRVTELEESTRNTYEGYIARTIKPAFGNEPARKIDARALESLYTELRRCRARCDRRPFIEKHKSTEADHDCKARGCKVHTCRPLGASTVRQIHAILSGALGAAERWGWIDGNLARIARRPKQKPPEPDPPTPAEAAKLVEEAFRMDDDWGTLVWLAMTTGVRRGELAGLRFSRIDLDAEVIDLRRNWVRGKEKDTKTHQNRRIALDSETVVLLKEHRKRVQKRLKELGRKFTDDLFVFSGTKTPDHSEPYSPNAVTQRYKDMATRLGIDTHLHALRHYSATELLSAGIDLRTVAGRLGHGGGGATTLRVYAAWVAATDRKAAEILGSRMPKQSTRNTYRT
ncbi:tyrosine-type recombinase/integrase [Amycolatopsis aidingensis]|uniref:tyrosine-type recombinase/integrase n=1 Tax=Amycolatopsis aidingensis TaxID=2842453 RepID=UPI001C0B802B|nr:tyrosine-type recombinase/integrase [Amycolatopsis aidingensis]